jgi:peptidyl-prolyl cis-trans isomerase SurA
MLRRLLVVLSLTSMLIGAVVVDRVAIVVGKRVIKASDIDRDLRAAQFVNGEPLDLSPPAKKKIADRLIIQELIRQEIQNGGYSQPTQQDVNAFSRQLIRDRFSGSDAKYRAALSGYGLSEDQVRDYLRWQLTVLRFIEERFRPGVLVTDEDIRAYYEEHRAELQKAHPQNNTFEALAPKIREIIAGERVNEAFDQWLDEMRRRTRIEYREAAFGEGVLSEGARK